MAGKCLHLNPERSNIFRAGKTLAVAVMSPYILTGNFQLTNLYQLSEGCTNITDLAKLWINTVLEFII